MLTQYLNRQLAALAAYLAFCLLIRSVGLPPILILLLTIPSSIVYVRCLHRISKDYKFPDDEK